jgi:hypothetical protein
MSNTAADTGASNFTKMVADVLTKFIGSRDPFPGRPEYDPTISVIEERLTRQFNNGATGTRNASSFSEVEVDLPCHIMGEVWLQYARGAVTSTGGSPVANVRKAGYFLDHEVYSSIDHVDLMQGSVVAYRISGDRMKQLYMSQWAPLQKAAESAGAAALRSDDERKKLAASAQTLTARLIFPWTNNPEAYPFIANLKAKFRIRVYFKPWVQCFHHPGANGVPTGGAITNMNLLFDGYHVKADKLAAIKAIESMGGQAVKFDDYEAQLSDTFTCTNAASQTRNLQLQNIRGPVSGFRVYLRHQEHINDARLLAEPYSLPITTLQLLDNNKDVVVVEDYSKSGYGLVPANLETYDMAVKFPFEGIGAPSYVISWVPKFLLPETLNGNAACLRKVDRYNQLTLRVIFDGDLVNTGLARPYVAKTFVDEQTTAGVALTVENVQLDVWSWTANVFRLVGGAFRADEAYST